MAVDITGDWADKENQNGLGSNIRQWRSNGTTIVVLTSMTIFTVLSWAVCFWYHRRTKKKLVQEIEDGKVALARKG
jgi:hypothetical protein